MSQFNTMHVPLIQLGRQPKDRFAKALEQFAFMKGEAVALVRSMPQNQLKQTFTFVALALGTSYGLVQLLASVSH